jgi:alpha-N-arabinofuranosidase
MVVAEGGTSYNHAVMIAVSDEINGPYISNPRNPILSSRHLSYDHWVHSTGHADMVELLDGRWYMVALGIRGDEQRQSNMGRETHLIPVIWEREPYEWKGIKLEWPVCAPITGRVERINPLPFENTKQYRDDSFIDNFESEILALEWNFRRLPMSDSISLSAREGYLRLYPKAEIMKERSRFCFLGIRQKESDFEFSVRMEFQPEIENTEAGISLFQGDDNYINYTALVQDGKIVLKLVLAVPQKLPVVLEQEVLVDYHGEIIFKIISKNHRYHYAYSLDNAESFQSLAKTSANHILSHGYTGAYMGLYATGNGKSTKAYADFDWVRYQGHPRV